MKRIISHNKPSLGQKEINAIARVINNSWIVEGEKVAEFEDEFCKYLGLPSLHAVALSNGTSALYLALKVLGIKSGDEVITSTYVCSAVLNAIFMAGAKPVLTDINKSDFNISYQDIISKITRKTKAIIVPYTFGMPFDIGSIKSLGIPVVEDCAVALGSKIGNQFVGVFGEIAIFSFYASKVITTGNGGMLVSKYSEYIEKAKDYREFDCRKVYYPRFNFQMSDIQAAMGLEQLKKLNIFLKKRKQIAEHYVDICLNKGWDFQSTRNKNYFNNWYRFVLIIETNIVKKLKLHLKKNGIETIIPIEKWELLHNYLELEPKNFIIAEKITQTTLSLPIYPNLLNNNDLEEIIKYLKEF